MISKEINGLRRFVSNSGATASAAAGGALDQVADGYKVDAETLKGFKTWRAAACDRCHGPNQEGMVGARR